MIHRYSDHAANERTYLAWVRTGIAVMAFGFLVEKFDLFLVFAASRLPGQAAPVPDHTAGDVTGLLLLALGAAMMVVATMRYRRVGQDIDAEDERPARGNVSDFALVGLLLALGVTLFGFLAVTVFRYTV